MRPHDATVLQDSPVFHDAVAFREYLARQAEIGRGDHELPCYRRLLATEWETRTITRVPSLNWPTDLFVACEAPEAEITT